MSCSDEIGALASPRSNDGDLIHAFEQRHEMRKLIILPFLLVAASACGGSTADYQELAQEAITGNLAETNDVTISNASCDEPANTEVGTTFNCTADIEDFGAVEIIATIAEGDSVEVLIVE